jgi:hypothetical protein
MHGTHGAHMCSIACIDGSCHLVHLPLIDIMVSVACVCDISLVVTLDDWVAEDYQRNKLGLHIKQHDVKLNCYRCWFMLT